MKLAALLVISALAAGCATVVPPVSPAHPTAVYLTNYGKHSSLLLPDSAGHFNEYAYGDFKWFALNHVGIYDAFRALLFSTQPTLGRRQLLADDNVESMQHVTGAPHIARLIVPRQRVDDLIRRLDAEFLAAHDTTTYNVYFGLWFAKAGKHYSAFHNCNHATAAWMRTLDCRVNGPVMFSEFKVARPPASATK